MLRYFFDPLAPLRAFRLPFLFGIAMGGTVLLTGCGNKGPLYLPPDAPITEVGTGETSTSAEETREQTEEVHQ